MLSSDTSCAHVGWAGSALSPLPSPSIGLPSKRFYSKFGFNSELMYRLTITLKRYKARAHPERITAKALNFFYVEPFIERPAERRGRRHELPAVPRHEGVKSRKIRTSWRQSPSRHARLRSVSLRIFT